MNSEEKNYEHPTAKKQSLEIEAWCEYAKAGVDIPVTTLLHGSSMEPLIRCKKDPVTIVPVKRELLVGDIVLFRRKDGAFVVHRLFRFSPDRTQVQTWGDNCRFPDEPINITDVLGIVLCMDKNGKKIMLNTAEQREYGVKWMNGSFKRRCWFYKKIIKSSCYGILRKTKKLFIKKSND